MELDLNEVVGVGPLIGHSMGWLGSKFGPSIHLRSMLLSLSDSKFAEIMCLPDEGLDIGSVSAISIHLPNYSNYKKSPKSKLNLALKATDRIIKSKNIFNATLHADAASSNLIFDLKKHNIPVAIENMDRSKLLGKLPFDVIKICKDHKLPLVLDLQHAYEVSLDLYGPNHTTEIATQFALLARKTHGISLLHVSGEISVGNKIYSNHASLLAATNKKEILEALCKVTKILKGNLPPIVLEGDYLPQIKAGKTVNPNITKYLETAALNMKLEREMILDVIHDSFNCGSTSLVSRKRC